MGVRAVVCAGWAVDDAAALTFAEAFYGRMLAGSEFGDAVRRARRDLEREPGVNTWGAYRCYGDPGGCAEGTGLDRAAPPAFAPSELATELDNLTESIGMISRRRERDEAAIAQDLRERVDGLLALRCPAARAGGMKRADVCASLALPTARASCSRRLRVAGPRAALQPGDCPVRAAEQFANSRCGRRGGVVGAARARRRRGERGPAGCGAPAGRADRARALPARPHQRARHHRRAAAAAAGQRVTSARPGCSRAGRASRRCSTWRSTTAKPRAQGGDDVYAFNNWAVACLLLRRLDPSALPATGCRRWPR